MKLTIIRGVSGSGKSTWARNQNAMVVSRDQIRLDVAPDVRKPMDVDRELVTLIEESAVAGLLSKGRDVIVDDTNITWRYVTRLAEIGWANGADVEVKVFDVPLEQCIKNNDHRSMMGGRFVPHDVIKRQHDR